MAFIFLYTIIAMPGLLLFIAFPLALLLFIFILTVKFFRYIYERRHPEVKDDPAWEYSIWNILP